MPQPQLSVRSARARELAHSLAKRERRTVADIVERALEEYAAHQTGRSPAAEFYQNLNRRFATNLDLEEILQSERRAHDGVDL
ncbi:MAG: hypothetical protein ACI8W7_001091 [Gammaproteobacteria bacterium]|jgi:hypothetical protein